MQSALPPREDANTVGQPLFPSNEAGEQTHAADLAVIAHQLRTPLAAIALWAKVLRSSRLHPERFDEALNGIESSVQVQRAAISELLEQGEQHLAQRARNEKRQPK